MSKADLAARAAQAKARVPRTTPAAVKVPTSKLVKVSAALAPDLYRKLTRCTDDIADQVGVSKVHHVELIRALINELAESPDLKKAVAARIEEERLE